MSGFYNLLNKKLKRDLDSLLITMKMKMKIKMLMFYVSEPGHGRHIDMI